MMHALCKSVYVVRFKQVRGLNVPWWYVHSNCRSVRSVGLQDFVQRWWLQEKNLLAQSGRALDLASSVCLYTIARFYQVEVR